MAGIKIRKIGTLGVIASLLICSAGLRLVGVSSIAIASSENGQLPANEPAVANSTQSDGEIDALLSSFKSRKQQLDLADARITARQEKLESAEAAIALKIKELAEAETRLRELLAIADSASEDDVARLTSVYENMKPKAAAVVFEEMEPAFAAGFLARMRPDAAAAVMAGLKSKTAYAVSVVLAGRHTEFQTK